MKLDPRTELKLIAGGYNPADAQYLRGGKVPKKVEDMYGTKQVGSRLFFNGPATIHVSNGNLESIFLTDSLIVFNGAGHEFALSSLESGKPGMIKHKVIISKRGAPAASAIRSPLSKNSFELYTAESSASLSDAHKILGPANYNTKISFQIGNRTEALYWENYMDSGQTLLRFWENISQETGLRFRKVVPKGIPYEPKSWKFHAKAQKSQTEIEARSNVGSTWVSVDFKEPHRTSIVQKLFGNLPVRLDEGKNTTWATLETLEVWDVVSFLNRLRTFVDGK